MEIESKETNAPLDPVQSVACAGGYIALPPRLRMTIIE